MKTSSVLLLGVLCLGANCVVSAKDVERNPVILVPGFMGSVLQTRNPDYNPHEPMYGPEWKHAWLNPDEVIYDVLKDLNNLDLVYNNVTHQTHDTVDGFGEPVEVRVAPGLDGVSKMSNHSFTDSKKPTLYLATMIKMFESQGYIKNKNLHAVPYDWRKSYSELGEWSHNTTELIESTYEKNGNRKVMLIAHSMGAPLTLHFLNSKTQEWKDKYINNFISLAGAWGGSRMAIFAYLFTFFGVSPYNSIHHLALRFRTFPSLYWMFPSEMAYKDEPILQLDWLSRNLTAAELGDFVRDQGRDTEAYMMWQDTRKLMEDLKFPGVKTLCLVGGGLPMVQVPFHLDDDYSFTMQGPNNEDWNGRVLISKDVYDSDGTLEHQSTELCRRWEAENKPGREKMFHFKKFHQMDHLGMEYKMRPLSTLMKFVLSEQEDK